MLKDVDVTPDDPEELRAVNRLLADEIKSQAPLIKKLKHQLADQDRHRFGVRSQSLDQHNLTFKEDEEIAEPATEQAKPGRPPAEDRTPRRHSRKSQPDHLDWHDEVLSQGEDCTRCGGKLKTLGEDVTEELEYVPGRFVVNRIVRPCKAITVALAPHRAWATRPRPFGVGARRQIRRSPASLSPEPNLCQRRD
ncbi:MAG: IS66 family transposase zinc-finger binding domain-containing protein [Pseudomonadota bacterium]